VRQVSGSQIRGCDRGLAQRGASPTGDDAVRSNAAAANDAVTMLVSRRVLPCLAVVLMTVVVVVVLSIIVILMRRRAWGSV
jgi:hypothetical protein